MTAAKVQEMPSPSPAAPAIEKLAIVQLAPAPWNARQNVSEAAIDELAASIRQQGIIVPLIVRPLKGVEKFASAPLYEIVAGHRRFLAARALKMVELPCQVRALTDAEAREVGLVDNLQRRDLSALEEAEAYQQMFQLAGDSDRPLTPAELAARVGKAEGYVRLRLRLLSAEAAVRDALREGRILLGHALELARLEASAQKDLLQWLQFEPYGIYGGGKQKRENVPSLAELRRHIQQEVLLDLAKAPFDTKDAKLTAAGSCVDCPKRTGNNQLLFADVKKGDICTDPACFAAKVTRSIDVRIEQLTAKGETAVRISEDYSSHRGLPEGTLTTQSYQELRGEKAKQRCDDFAVGVFVDGAERGKSVSICRRAGNCKLHGYSGNGGSRNADPAMKAKRAKARQEKACRMRIFRAAVEKSARLDKASDANIRALAAWAISRAYHNGAVDLMKLLDWPKELVNSEKKIAPKLATVTTGRAVAIALLGSCSMDLAVSEYNMRTPDDLHNVAKQLGVDVAAVRKAVAAEAAAKAKPAKKAVKAPSKKVAKKAAEVAREVFGLVASVARLATGPCSWVNAARTVCSNPQCMARRPRTPALERFRIRSSMSAQALVMVDRDAFGIAERWYHCCLRAIAMDSGILARALPGIRRAEAEP
jgi:ParB family chromosome partitioning protein